MFVVEEIGKVVRITMRRAPVNALNLQFVRQFGEVLDSLEAKTDMTVLHLRSDQSVFCAGADLAQVQSRFAMEDGASVMVSDIREMHQLFDRIENLPCVTVAEIGGAALGGGFELALAFDLRIAANDAKIGLPEARLGLIPGAGGTQRLTRLCGSAVAARIILSADVVDGETACALGMVQWAVASDQLAQEAQALVSRVESLALPALKVAKNCIAYARGNDAAGFENELQGTYGLMGSPEAQERVADFFARKK